MNETIENIFRFLIWKVVELTMFLIDAIWEIIMRIATLNFATSVDLSPWYLLVSCFLFMFIIFRVIKITVKFFFDDEYRDRVRVGKILIMLCAASFLSAFIPIGFSEVCSISSRAVENIGTFIPAETEDITMSSILLEAGKIDISNPENDLGDIPDISSESFDINEKYNGSYKYYPNISSVLLILITSFIFCYIFVIIALQVAQRFFSVICKYLFAPYVVATVIDPEDNIFTQWLKMLSADLMTNWIQIYGLYLIMYLSNSSQIHSMLGNDFLAILARIVFTIGGIFAVMELPTIIASLTGGRTAGIQQTMQDMKMMTAAATGMTGAASTVLNAGKSAVGLAYAGTKGSVLDTASAAGNFSRAYNTALQNGSSIGGAALAGLGSAAINSGAGKTIGSGINKIKSVPQNVKSSIASAYNGSGDAVNTADNTPLRKNTARNDGTDGSV